MIEKLDLDNGYATVDWLPTQHGKRCGAKEIQNTVNQIIDAVNELQMKVGHLEDGVVCKVFDNDDTDDIAEVKNENMPRPIKLYVCADGSMYDNEAVAKSHAANIFNPLPAGATTTDRVYLEQELARTKKKLEIAVDALKLFCGEDVSYYNQSKIDARDARTALEQITALEQKDVK